MTKLSTDSESTLNFTLGISYLYYFLFLRFFNNLWGLSPLIDNDHKFHKQTAAEAVKKGKSVLGLIKKSFAILT